MAEDRRGDDGKINRRLWEIATIAHLRNKLRSGDVWVERSAGYRRFDSYLLSEPKAKPIVSALGLPSDAETNGSNNGAANWTGG
jgi:hypothetical protein